LEIQSDRPLAGLCTLEVGGSAQYFAQASSETDLEAALRFARQGQLDLTVLGGGSNVVIADAGVSGLVLRIALMGRQVTHSKRGVELQIAAGEPWDDFVGWCVAQGWAGLECLSGIPGTVGATPIQNVGAYGQEVSSTLTSVRAFDRTENRWLQLSNADCVFAYRSSIFKKQHAGRYVVTGVNYCLTPGGAPLLKYEELTRAFDGQSSPPLPLVRDTVIALRRKKSMVLETSDSNRRSCGSFFLNHVVTASELEHIRSVASKAPPAFPQGNGAFKVPAAWLIEQAGFQKGYCRGPVGLSTRHALAVVCHEGATASNVVAFAHEVRRGVQDRFAVKLRPEPVFLGFDRFDDGLPIEP